MIDLTSKLVRSARSLLKTAVTVIAPLTIARMAARHTNLIERFFIYFPERVICETPAGRDIDFEEVFFTTSDEIRLHGWFVPGMTEVTWVWFHGNSGNIGSRLENLAALHKHMGTSIFIFDYPRLWV